MSNTENTELATGALSHLSVELGTPTTSDEQFYCVFTGKPIEQVLADIGREAAKEKCNCCERGDQYNGLGSGPLLFVCPKSCQCHD